MPTDESLQLVEDCEKREARLSAWEHDFIVSIRNQLEVGRDLSKKQTDMLETLWERVTARG